MAIEIAASNTHFVGSRSTSSGQAESRPTDARENSRVAFCRLIFRDVRGPGECLQNASALEALPPIFTFFWRESRIINDIPNWFWYPRGMHLSGRKYSSGTRPWTQRQRIVLLALISANLAVFIAQLLLETDQPNFVRDYLGISDRGVRDAYAWQFITAAFLHTGPWHLLGNLLILYFLGRDLESILGQRHFLYLYLAGAFGGELGHLFLMPSQTVLLGASGGVAAIVTAYAVVLPELELTTNKLFVSPLHLKPKHIAYGVVVLGLVLLCVDRKGPVSHSAYLGGCAAGWLYAHLLGFGRPSLLRRFLRRRRAEAERYARMSIEQVMCEEIDPLLEKISRKGIGSLTRVERRNLARARERMVEKTQLE